RCHATWPYVCGARARQCLGERPNTAPITAPSPSEPRRCPRRGNFNSLPERPVVADAVPPSPPYGPQVDGSLLGHTPATLGSPYCFVPPDGPYTGPATVVSAGPGLTTTVQTPVMPSMQLCAPAAVPPRPPIHTSSQVVAPLG